MVGGEDDEALAWIALATALAGLRAELRRRRLDPVVPLAVVGAVDALDAVLLNLGQAPVIGVPRVSAAELLADARSALTLLTGNDEAWELPIDRLLILARTAPCSVRSNGSCSPVPGHRPDPPDGEGGRGIADTSVCPGLAGARYAN